MPNIDPLGVDAFHVPADTPESDGTICREGTTVMVERTLKPLVLGEDAMAIETAAVRLGQAVRNFGRSGLGISLGEGEAERLAM